MFETNTASCGGFPGVSDSFGSTLWMVDYALQMAYSNFTMALMHVGGVDDTYNVSSILFLAFCIILTPIIDVFLQPFTRKSSLYGVCRHIFKY